ncbi:type II secretion system protein GspD [Novosphingobium naphthalenivorans]|uniref:type II secretion system protein GspD n=1 Tax=Novosphingobium naphthalenivorans TaxID=273168 RepID=UPI000832D297|nr:hypothetical protein [Novosphingobium naphthalenivorans]
MNVMRCAHFSRQAAASIAAGVFINHSKMCPRLAPGSHRGVLKRKSLFLLPLAALFGGVATAKPFEPFSAAPTLAPSGVFLQLDAVPLGEVVTIMFRDILKTPYVVAPEVGADRRPVSVRLDVPLPKARAAVMAYLKAFGLQVDRVAGVDQVRLVGGSSGAGFLPSVEGSAPMALAAPVNPSVYAEQSPRSADPRAGVEETAAAYWPRFRSPAYLANVLGSLLPKLRFGSNPADEPRLGFQTDQAQSRDLLAFIGPVQDVENARAVLTAIDVAEVGLSIKATVYEVQTGSLNQSALSLAASLLGGRFGVAVGGSASPMDNFLKLTTGNVQAALGVLSSDNRFRVVTAPSVLARSGTPAVLTSGSQVPVLGSISYEGQSGTPVQSVVYRDSGVILKVTPTAYHDVVDLAVDQEISSFVRTDTGVSGSPTLIKRSATNRVSVAPGEVVVLGGLTDERDTSAKSGFLGLFPSKRTEKSRTEILMVLQVDRSSAQGFAPAPQRSEEQAQTLLLPSLSAPSDEQGL